MNLTNNNIKSFHKEDEFVVHRCCQTDLCT